MRKELRKFAIRGMLLFGVLWWMAQSIGWSGAIAVFVLVWVNEFFRALDEAK